MHWKLSSREKHDALSQKFCLPVSIKQVQVAFRFLKDNECFALSQAPLDTNDPFPVAELLWEELSDAIAWQKLLTLHPLPQIDTAHYWQKFLSPQGIDASILLTSCRIPVHFHNIADWKELSSLGKACRILNRRYDFGLRILRLWNRFEKEEQEAWLDMWEKHSFGRNLIQEIIGNYYELSESRRKLALEKAHVIIQSKLESTTGKPAGHKKAFLQKEIRDIVQELRFPKSRQMQKKFIQKKKRIEQKLCQKIPVEFPLHLEMDQLQVKINFDSIHVLEKQLHLLHQKEVQELFNEVLHS